MPLSTPVHSAKHLEDALTGARMDRRRRENRNDFDWSVQTRRWQRTRIKWRLWLGKDMNVETSSGPGKRSLLRSRSDGEILNSATTYVPNPGPYLTPPTTPHSFRDGTDLSPSVPRLRALSNREHARSRLAALHDGSIGCRRAVIPADQCSRPPSQRNLYATTASTRGSQPPSVGRQAGACHLSRTLATRPLPYHTRTALKTSKSPR
ncbi:uncharacterized protein B0H18DRAFT_114420 [Fomitopsis serialis]|uniref:uncharacterized protein n=1 Tax=Fomitopsis serialis TaxID=139415 RepID=UPI0020081058|nr:uncharacterized protein B0H18DRAFT_114420 [Neoantrodia serialis]KAH9914936.1 hypothetical protein B0H18DRAFT_114420 [Neoantrodia serialis]